MENARRDMELGRVSFSRIFFPCRNTPCHTVPYQTLSCVYRMTMAI